MGKKKERKPRLVKIEPIEGVESEVKAEPPENGVVEATESMEITETFEKCEEEEVGESQTNEDYQKEFAVLGQHEFIDRKRISVTSTWISQATMFPASLDSEYLSDLSTVKGLPTPLSEYCKKNIEKWFPVQKSVLPSLLTELSRPSILRPRDVAIAAPTGSGKTLCYVLPCLAAAGENPKGTITSIVVVPVQTLVKQVEEEFAKFNACGARVVALSGATEYEKERNKLFGSNGKTIADIIVATPDRLVKHLTDPKGKMDISRVRFLVCDEADRMGPLIRMEWLELVESRSGASVRAATLGEVVRTRCAPRKILLSATLSKDVEELHAWNLHRPCLFRATVSQSHEVALDNLDHVSGRLSLPTNIQHSVLTCDLKFHPLLVYQKVAETDWKRVLVFTNQRQSSFRLAHVISQLAGEKFKVEQLTADLFGNRRAKVLKRFKSGATRILICSDVLSRGVDVPGIDCVINYDLPSDDRLFVHRAGRTARAGAHGVLLTITEKEARRPFQRLLLRNGLWTNVTERAVEAVEFNDNLEKYRAALDGLKKLTVSKGDDKHKKQPLPKPKKRKRPQANTNNQTANGEVPEQRWSNNKEKKDY